MATSTKLSINNSELAEEFFSGTRLIGIMTPTPAYQFCHYLNKSMGLDFRINNDLQIQLSKKNRDYFFDVYEYVEPDGAMCHYLYKNQSQGGYLLPEFRNLDFLWLLKGDINTDNLINETLTNIKSISSVLLVTELSDEKIKNKEHLIL